MKKILIASCFLLLFLIVPLLPFAPFMDLRRNVALAQFQKNNNTIARLLYKTLAWNNDPIGLNNWAVLEFETNYPKRKKGENKKAWRKKFRVFYKEIDDALHKASKAYEVTAYYNLGTLRANAKYKSKRYRQALSYFKLAARFGDPKAKAFLEKFKDKDKSSIYTALADIGEINAAKTAASIFHWQDNRSSKLFYLSKAAEGGNIYAKTSLAQALTNQPEPPENPNKVLMLHKEAADAGINTSANELGDCYQYGENFCGQQDYSQAVYWYKKAILPYPGRFRLKAHVTQNGALRRYVSQKYYPARFGMDHSKYELAKLKILGLGTAQNIPAAQKIIDSCKDNIGDEIRQLRHALNGNIKGRITQTLKSAKWYIERGDFEDILPAIKAGHLLKATPFDVVNLQKKMQNNLEKPKPLKNLNKILELLRGNRLYVLFDESLVTHEALEKAGIKLLIRYNSPLNDNSGIYETIRAL